MIKSLEFLDGVLDSVTIHITVIDKNGFIVYVNQGWERFAKENSCNISSNWKNINYLEVCDKAAKAGDNFGIEASLGIRSVIIGESEKFYLEYPCHSPNEKRWFMMRVIPFALEDGDYFVITHQNITERKHAENEVAKLARIDGLTGIANRRSFDEFIYNQYRRSMRQKHPITLAMIDLDHFKLLNDTYGHQAGDECLQKVARVLEKYTNRADDLCARYGGEEFAIIWGSTPLKTIKPFIQKLLDEISELKIPNKHAQPHEYLTASIGVAELTPELNSTELVLIQRADEKLYKAKKNGRNRIEY